MKKLLSLILVAIMLVTTMPMAFAEGETYKVGDIIQFGSYPQSEVTDEVIISALNAKAPEWDNWTSYGYYNGNYSDGSMKPGNWMRYVDIKLDGEKYRGVKFTQYRPYITRYPSSDDTSFQDGHGYVTYTAYWFKFESIDWRVLDPSTGFVMCETVIDSQPYSNTLYDGGDEDYNDSSYTNYANDYETSSIRKWLNNDFYNTAFTDIEKEKIATTTLNNDGVLTSTGTTGYEKYDSNETKDKIFLLSYNEVINSNFGFDSEPWVDDTARIGGKVSDYAQSQGLCGNGEYDFEWLLRSPSSVYCWCCGVYAGIVGYDYYVGDSSEGVRPALCFKDIENFKHQHTYNTVVTNPTCKDRGYTTYTCECGYSYVDNFVNTVKHKDENKDRKCDYGCGYEFEKLAPENEPENKPEKELNFFEKIIEWFKNLFDKLFGWMKK